ncbi:MAG: ArgE/DapE family deacylase [Nitrospinota bacterium]
MEPTPEERRVLGWIDSHKEDAIRFLRDLVRIPSLTGEEGKGQRFIADYLKGMGIEVETCVADLRALEGHPEFIPVDPEVNVGNYGERPNIIGRYRGSGDGRSLLLFAHVDTVPAGEGWDFDPFGGEIADGRMYGLGAADMKAGMASSFYALKACVESGVRLRGDVLCMSNIEEEIGGSGGILACVEKGYRADAAIHPHPGEGKPPLVLIASSGVLSFRVRVQGKTVHGFQAHMGVNAIEKAFRIAETLWELDRHRAVTAREELTEAVYYLTGRPVRAVNLYLSAVRGGGWLYQVPPTCEMDWVYTFPNNETLEANQVLIEETVNAAAAADPWLRENPPELKWLSVKFSPCRNDPDHPFVSLAAECIRFASGEQVHLAATPVGSDMRVPCIYGKMPTINIGPLGGQMHAPNEWVDIASFVTSVKMFSLLLMRWCGVAS